MARRGLLRGSGLSACRPERLQVEQRRAGGPSQRDCFSVAGASIPRQAERDSVAQADGGCVLVSAASGAAALQLCNTLCRWAGNAALGCFS